ncbi:MAG: hypothetical protein IAF58_04240 [Leptolyngbya sp.]|nr:hypothetical protein [Candidatus Melainabacteria bacterium]
MKAFEINEHPSKYPDRPASEAVHCENDVLDKIYIAAPCDADWDKMKGDDSKRFCGDCKLNVYNISSMSSRDARKLITTSEGRLCLKLYRRKDGTIITDNCPVGLRKIRDRVKKVAIAVCLACVWLGLISDASAQGIVGAPLDPRYGVSGQYSESQTIVETQQPAISALPIATTLSTLVLLWSLCFKRITMLHTAIALAGLWAITGVIYGFEGRDHYFTSNAAAIWLTFVNR